MNQIRRVPFDERFRDLSFTWLNDPEMARLTDSPQFTRDEQLAWYAGLADRTDYAVWGIEYDGVPVGAMGLKSIGLDQGGEYFMYIGDRAYWGRGIARWAFDEIVAEACRRRLRFLYGRVVKGNDRSLAVDLRHGFRIAREEPGHYWLVYPLTPAVRRRRRRALPADALSRSA
jgi:RimJ/RimL family protein N-acetyltransferase